MILSLDLGKNNKTAYLNNSKILFYRDIMTQFKLKISFFILTSFCVFSIHAADKLGMRNGRYCEIILSNSFTQYKVYNTWGLNTCPEDKWRTITTSNVEKETQFAHVRLNGPRYWVIDGFKHTRLINPQIKVIGGISMREAGVLHLSLKDLLSANRPYQTHVVNRKTTWIYQANKPVYELIDPKGHVYVMQSYSIEKQAQTIDSLSQLGTTLKLPRGWHFKTGKLNKTKNLVVEKEHAIVIQDNFMNTYTLAPQDLLP